MSGSVSPVNPHLMTDKPQFSPLSFITVNTGSQQELKATKAEGVLGLSGFMNCPSLSCLQFLMENQASHLLVKIVLDLQNRNDQHIRKGRNNLNSNLIFKKKYRSIFYSTK